MPTIKLTRKAIQSTVADNKRVDLYDTEVKGFHCRVTPSGKKTFYYYYRTQSGRERRYKIGDFPALTPEQARDMARDLHSIVRSGGDPSLNKLRARDMPSLSEFADRFMTEHVKARRKEKTAYEYQKLVDNHIKPNLGGLPLNEVSRNDVVKLHHKLSSTPYQANRVLAVLSKIFNIAEKWGFRPDGSNPCRHVEKYPEKGRERYLTSYELSALGETLAEFEDKKLCPKNAIAAIRLLIFTGARRDEILKLEWDHVDLNRALLILPDSKTGQKSIILSPGALEVITGIKRISGNPYVITGKVEGKPLQGLQKIWERIRIAATIKLWEQSSELNDLISTMGRELERSPTPQEVRLHAEEKNLDVPAGLDDVRIHDLRHSFASVGAAAGLSLPVIGKMLGHSQAATTHRYAHLAEDPIRRSVDIVGGWIAEAMSKHRASS